MAHGCASNTALKRLLSAFSKAPQAASVQIANAFSLILPCHKLLADLGSLSRGVCIFCRCFPVWVPGSFVWQLPSRLMGHDGGRASARGDIAEGVHFVLVELALWRIHDDAILLKALEDYLEVFGTIRISSIYALAKPKLLSISPINMVFCIMAKLSGGRNFQILS